MVKRSMHIADPWRNIYITDFENAADPSDAIAGWLLVAALSDDEVEKQYAFRGDRSSTLFQDFLEFLPVETHKGIELAITKKFNKESHGTKVLSFLAHAFSAAWHEDIEKQPWPRDFLNRLYDLVMEMATKMDPSRQEDVAVFTHILDTTQWHLRENPESIEIKNKAIAVAESWIKNIDPANSKAHHFFVFKFLNEFATDEQLAVHKDWFSKALASSKTEAEKWEINQKNFEEFGGRIFALAA